MLFLYEVIDYSENVNFCVFLRFYWLMSNIVDVIMIIVCVFVFNVVLLL